MHDPFDHESAGPSLADVLDVAPHEASAIREVARHVTGEDGHASRGVGILEVRHAMLGQRAQERAEEPARTHQAIPGKPRPGSQRAREARAQVVLLVRVRGCVDGEHKRLVAGARRAIDERVDLRKLTRQVGLEPGVLRLGHYLFQTDQRRSREHHGNVGGMRAASEHQVAAIRGHCADAHRPDAEGMRVGPAQQLDRLRAVGHAYQHARQETPLEERRAVVAARDVVLDAARYVAEERARKVAPCGRLEVVEPEDVTQAARAAPRRCRKLRRADTGVRHRLARGHRHANVQ
jgi:hypothetical protein